MNRRTVYERDRSSGTLAIEELSERGAREKLAEIGEHARALIFRPGENANLNAGLVNQVDRCGERGQKGFAAAARREDNRIERLGDDGRRRCGEQRVSKVRMRNVVKMRRVAAQSRRARERYAKCLLDPGVKLIVSLRS